MPGCLGVHVGTPSEASAWCPANEYSLAAKLVEEKPCHVNSTARSSHLGSVGACLEQPAARAQPFSCLHATERPPWGRVWSHKRRTARKFGANVLPGAHGDHVDTRRHLSRFFGSRSEHFRARFSTLTRWRPWMWTPIHSKFAMTWRIRSS